MKTRALLIGIGLLFLPRVIFAAQIFVAKNFSNATGTCSLVLRADTPVNAVEGIVRLPTSTQIGTGSSVVQFWIDQPAEDASGRVVFSGIMPGGFRGQGDILNYDCTSTDPDPLFNYVHLYANDGAGTPVPVMFASSTVSRDGTPSEPDTVPPEEFTPAVSRDSSVFDDKYFVAFQTTDKQSGIDHYEVKEGDRDWVRADSPYELRDQSLSGPILVKAVDRAGNYISVAAPSRSVSLTPFFLAENWIWALALVLIILISLAVLLWRKKQRSSR